MAKPTKYAPHICTVSSLLAFTGIIMGLVFSTPAIIVISLFPAAIYQAYRTEGKSTKAASILLVFILFVQLLLIFFNINFNVAEYFDVDHKNIGGYLVPLGEIKVLGPTIIAVLSVVLFTKTWGIYTKWLSIVIFITAFAIVYTLDPNVFHDLLKFALEEGFNSIR